MAEELELDRAGVKRRVAGDVVDDLVARPLPLVRRSCIVVPAEAPRLPRGPADVHDGGGRADAGVCAACQVLFVRRNARDVAFELT